MRGEKSNATKRVERTRNSRPRKERDGVTSGIIYMRILLGISFLFCPLALLPIRLWSGSSDRREMEMDACK